MGRAMAKRWYVIETVDRRDEDATLRLCAAGFEAWRPVDVVRSPRRPVGRRAAATRGEPRIERKISRFGRFVFLRVDLNACVRSAVLSVASVRRFLCFAGTDDPASVPDDLIAYYREHVPVRWPSLVVYQVGQVVEFTGGPFEGRAARVKRVDERGILSVELDVLGRATPIVVEVAHVRPSELLKAKPPPGRAFEEVA